MLDSALYEHFFLSWFLQHYTTGSLVDFRVNFGTNSKSANTPSLKENDYSQNRHFVSAFIIKIHI